MNKTGDTPRGVVGIFTDKLGRVIETVSDFDESGFGGYSLKEAQTYRAKHKLAFAVMNAYCSEMVLEGIEDSDCMRIIQRLVTKGARTTFIPIGHEGNDE